MARGRKLAETQTEDGELIVTDDIVDEHSDEEDEAPSVTSGPSSPGKTLCK